MDEEVKVNFSRPMMVLKIRETYKAPYHKNKYVTVKPIHLENIFVFKKHVQQYTGNWSSGSYDLQYILKEGTYMQTAIYATFCRIEVRDGKISTILKNSPYSKKPYPCWQYIGKVKRKKPVKKGTKAKPKKKVVKKKVVKKKIAKKPVKKKTVKSKKVVKKKK
jgi:hypothetical protein